MMPANRGRFEFTKSCLLALGIFLLFAAGCANPFTKHYRSTIDQWPRAKSLLAEGPADPTGPRLVTTKDMKADSLSMLENGYFMIGVSTFRSPPVDERMSLQQARQVGADAVLVKQEFVSTVTQSVPITEWIPDRSITTTERSTFRDSPAADPKTIEREITQTLQGEAQTTYVPQSTDYYEYSTTFWKKTKPLKFGVLVRPLNEESKKKLQTNKGVSVRVVVKRSPAFDADILRGDIITHFNGEPVVDPEDFFDKIDSCAGQKVTVKVVRDKKKLDIEVTLRGNAP